MRFKTGERRSWSSKWLAAAVLTLLAAVAVAVPAHAGKIVADFFPTVGAPSGAGGSFSTPRDVDVNDPAITSDGSGQSSWIYVADSGNNRIQAFDADGDLQFAIGADVVATGPGNGGTAEVQQLVVRATSGTFTLSFGGDATGPLAWNAGPGAVESALIALDSVGGVGGSVDVTGGVGDATGSSPYVITFGGALGGFNVGQVSVDPSGLGIPVGTELACASTTSATTTSFQWLSDGEPATGPGAATASYTTVAADAGNPVQCQVVKQNAANGSTQVSNPRSIVSDAPTPRPPLAPSGNISPPSPSSPIEGTELLCNPGAANWTGVTQPFEYQWHRNGVSLGSANGAQTDTYTVQAADVPGTFQCAVTGSNAGGSVTKVSQNRNTGGSPSPGTPPGGTTGSPAVTVTGPATTSSTTTEGVPAAEVCVPGDGAVCKAAIAGTLGGTFSNPQGVAIDQVDGSFYVRDTGNQRIQQFDADGAFVQAMGADVDQPSGGSAYEVCITDTNCKAGAAGTGAGAFSASTTASNGIAVSPATREVFVADPGSSSSTGRRIVQLDPDAVDGGDADSYPDGFVRAWGGGVDTASNALFEICTVASSCQQGVNPPAANPPPPNPPGHFPSQSPAHVAIDGDGIVYSWFNPFSGGPRIVRFDPALAPGGCSATPGTCDASATLLPDIGGVSGVTALDLDPVNERVYVARGATEGIDEYDISVEPPALTGDSPHMAQTGLAQNGLAHDATLGRLYASSSSGSPAAHRVYVLDDDGATGDPAVTLHPPTDVEADSAELSATINPDGFPTSVRFQVSKTGLANDWQNAGPAIDLVADSSDQEVGTFAGGLEPGTLYRVRVAVTRGFGNGTVFSAELTFATDPAPPVVTTEPSPGASDSAAFIVGTVNPRNAPTSYWFEYGGTTNYGQTAPIPAASAGSGLTAQTVSHQLTGLAPNTAYHYRLCATNAYSPTAVCGIDRSFTTEPFVDGASDSARAYELVSPADKVMGPGAGVHAHNQRLDGEAGVTPGLPAASGERMLVFAPYGPILTGGATAFTTDVVQAERDSNLGWRQRSAFNRPNHSNSTAPFLVMSRTTADLSLMHFSTLGGWALLFDEMSDESDPTHAQYVRDWDGKWELIDSVDFGHLPDDNTDPTTAIARDGSATTYVDKDGGRGLLGPGDPSEGFVTGANSAYLYEAPPGGPSDTFDASDPFASGPTELLGVCAGGTELPSVDAGEIGTRSCADGDLIDTRGSSIFAHPAAFSSRDLLSRDGARAFFMSPDPGLVSDPDDAGPLDGSTTPCTDASGPATVCPTQLFVRQRGGDGGVDVRWVSQSAVDGQDADLVAPVYYEGASADGDKVFFKTAAPLTPDDRNGVGSAPPDGGVVDGAASGTSWDLFMYDMPNGPDSDPATPDNDPSGGTLTRISAGPDGSDTDGYGDGDCNVVQQVSSSFNDAALRYASEDGSRVYFTCLHALPGVAGNDSSTTTPGTGSGTINLYLFDANKPSGPVDQRWSFVARLPRLGTKGGGADKIDQCATTAAAEGESRIAGAVLSTERVGYAVAGNRNCVRGSADGGLVTFWTSGAITADDSVDGVADIYAFEAGDGELSRISAPRGGAGGSYLCAQNFPSGAPTQFCNADPGLASSNGWDAAWHDQLAVSTDPVTGRQAAYFESNGRLLSEDQDDFMDVYAWSEDVLTLVSKGIEHDHAHYSGNSEDGKSVFMVTRQDLSWQDVDAVRDVYVARVGGGIPQPPAPPVCGVLAGGCMGAGAAVAPASARTDTGGANADPGARTTVTLGSIGRRAARRAAKAGRLSVRVGASEAGRLVVTARAKVIGVRRRAVVARGSARIARPGRRATVRMRLNAAAMRHLRTGRPLRLTLSTSMAGALPRTATVLLRRAGR